MLSLGIWFWSVRENGCLHLGVSKEDQCTSSTLCWTHNPKIYLGIEQGASWIKQVYTVLSDFMLQHFMQSGYHLHNCLLLYKWHTMMACMFCHKHVGHHQGSSSRKIQILLRFSNGRFFQNVFCMTDWSDDIQSTVNCCTTDAVLNSCVNNTISIYSVSQWDAFHINFTVLLHIIKS